MPEDPTQRRLGDASLENLSGPEVDRLIRRCASALGSHAYDFSKGTDNENALVAFESTLALLLEIRDRYPAKQADIDAVLHEHCYPLRED